LFATNEPPVIAAMVPKLAIPPPGGIPSQVVALHWHLLFVTAVFGFVFVDLPWFSR
jgi:hypothetical protein